MKRKIWGVSLVLGLCLLLYLPSIVLADVSLPGYQQLGGNSHLTVTADELRDYPFYFSLSSDISISKISL
ncbi:MAG: hypothetical protein U9R29_03610, partial [Thermodesulfobacteriota bacterium]|nr:hypothetical protein [Thermodesulfobacteriota bacterium]